MADNDFQKARVLFDKGMNEFDCKKYKEVIKSDVLNTLLNNILEIEKRLNEFRIKINRNFISRKFFFFWIINI